MRRFLAFVLLVVAPAAFGATKSVPKNHVVNLDVKDEEVHVILKSMQKQCGIKNLIIDPGVSGQGTFLFHDLPCTTAFDVVLRTLDLGSVTYPNSVMQVRPKRQ